MVQDKRLRHISIVEAHFFDLPLCILPMFAGNVVIFCKFLSLGESTRSFREL